MSTITDERLSGTYTLDKVHSTAGFSVKHMVVATFRGEFDDFDATLVDGRFEGTVRVDSLEVKDENLSAHIKSPDFFDSARYPEIKFVSTGIETNGDEIVVRGELTIKDNTRPVEARGTISGPAVDLGENTKIGIELETVVDRTQFGLNWNAPLPRGGFAVANDVKLHVALELARTEA